jgi:integrase
MRAWLYQDHRQKQKLGEDKCPWSVGWIDPDGRRRSKRVGSKSQADKFRRKVEGELAAGLYQGYSRKSWKAFKVEFEGKVMAGMEPGTRGLTNIALKHFERIANPKYVDSIKGQTVDHYKSVRRHERGVKRDSKVSPATINKELRHIKVVLRIAHEWGYLPSVPKIRMLREPEKLPRYVSPDHFAAIYKACDVAKRPAGLPYGPPAWWRALVTFCYMTGWRISEPLALGRDDLDLDTGTAVTRHGDNKGKRDELVPLHPVVVDHLKRIKSFEPLVFPWYCGRERLWEEFQRIQEAAGIHLPCHEKHEHTPRCHIYGFHDLRRAFATENADTLSADALQRLMRHKSYTTTQRYINMADKLKGAVDKLHVPDALRQAN